MAGNWCWHRVGWHRPSASRCREVLPPAPVAPCLLPGIPREGSKLPSPAHPNGGPGQGKGGDARCPAGGGLAGMQPIACAPGKDEVAGWMLLEGLGRSRWPHAIRAVQRGPWPQGRGGRQPCASLAGHPLAHAVSPWAREPCRGRGLAPFPAAPRCLGRPRHSPALSSRFRRISVGPRQPTPPRSPLRHGGDAQPGKGPRAKWQHPSPLPPAPGFGKGISAKANPSGSPAVTGRKLHYKSFRHELYYRATPHRFPQASSSRLRVSTSLLSRRASHAAMAPLGSRGAQGERRAGGGDVSVTRGAGLSPRGGRLPSPPARARRQMCHLIAMFPFRAGAGFYFSPGASSREHPQPAVLAAWQGDGDGEQGRGKPPQTGQGLWIFDPAAWLQGRGVDLSAPSSKHLPADGPRGSKESAGKLLSRRQGRDGEAGFLLLSGCLPALPPLLPVPHGAPPQAPRTPQAPMLSPASPYQGTPPSIPPFPPRAPEGNGTLWAAVPREPRCARTPRHSPSCHVDDTSLARTTSRTGAASCAMPGGPGAGQPTCLLGSRGSRGPPARRERGWKQDKGPLRRLVAAQTPDPPPCCCLC